jgi:hypothetical protein
MSAIPMVARCAARQFASLSSNERRALDDVQMRYIATGGSAEVPIWSVEGGRLGWVTVLISLKEDIPFLENASFF